MPLIFAISMLYAPLPLLEPDSSTRHVFTGTRKISVPICFDPDKKNQIKELRLYVSQDDGKTWGKVATAKPDESRFDYEAPRDGDYAMSLMIVSHDGTTDPLREGDLRPQLRVRIKLALSLVVEAKKTGTPDLRANLAKVEDEILETETHRIQKEIDDLGKNISKMKFKDALAKKNELRSRIDDLAAASNPIENVSNFNLKAASPLIVPVGSPNLVIGVSVSEPVQVGDDVPLLINVTNKGNSEANKILLKAVLTDGLKHAEGNDIQATLNRLGPGESQSIKLLVKAAESGSQSCSLSAALGGSVISTAQVKFEVGQAKIEPGDIRPDEVRGADRNGIYNRDRKFGDEPDGKSTGGRRLS